MDGVTDESRQRASLPLRFQLEAVVHVDLQRRCWASSRTSGHVRSPITKEPSADAEGWVADGERVTYAIAERP